MFRRCLRLFGVGLLAISFSWTTSWAAEQADTRARGDNQRPVRVEDNPYTWSSAERNAFLAEHLFGRGPNKDVLVRPRQKSVGYVHVGKIRFAVPLLFEQSLDLLAPPFPVNLSEADSNVGPSLLIFLNNGYMSPGERERKILVEVKRKYRDQVDQFLKSISRGRRVNTTMSSRMTWLR